MDPAIGGGRQHPRDTAMSNRNRAACGGLRRHAEGDPSTHCFHCGLFLQVKQKSKRNHVLPAEGRTHTRHMPFQSGALFLSSRGRNSEMGIFYGSPDPL